MNEFSFIEFDVTDSGCNLQLPVHSISDLRFFIPETMEGQPLSVITILDENYDYIKNCEFDFDSGFCSLKNTTITDLTCFRFNFYYTSGDPYYSNIFRFVPTKETTLVKYLCYEAQFGFDYTIADSFNQVRLPILIKEPQFPQEEKIYVDGNGVRKLLFAKIDKEYELETEYMPIDWHEKMVVILAHDEVYFDGEKLQKTGAYEIKYDEYDELSCGTRLYKASAKLTRNTTQRNNNC